MACVFVVWCWLVCVGRRFVLQRVLLCLLFGVFGVGHFVVVEVVCGLAVFVVV